MSTPDEAAYRRKFARRTAELRGRTPHTQETMAELLGVNLEAYKKYENLRPMPHRLVPRFCLLVGCDLSEMYSLDKPVAKKKSAKKAS